MDDHIKTVDSFVGCSIIGLLVVAILALLAAVLPFIKGEFVAAALLLLVSALSFGLLAFVLVRR